MGQRARPYVVVAAAAFALAACSTTPASDGGLTICRSMPADAGACSVNQTLLSCTDRDSGVATICLSDNANACPGDDPLTVDDCKSLCPSGSYAAACGGLPPADGGAQPSSAPPSDACTSNGGTPGGVATYCCPCGS